MHDHHTHTHAKSERNIIDALRVRWEKSLSQISENKTFAVLKT